MRPLPHQLEGIKFLEKKKRAILGDQLGLGKTMQAILATKPEQGVVVFCPDKLVHNWLNEWHMWRPDVNVEIISGSRKQRIRRINASDADVLLLGYWNLSQRDITDAVRDREYNYLIFDEAHALGNRKSARTQNAFLISKPSRVRHVYFLTGILISSRPGQLWPLLRIINGARFGSYWKWVNEYCVQERIWTAGGRTVKVVTGWKSENKINALLKRYYLRRTLSSLPKIVNKQIRITPDAQTLKLITQIKTGFIPVEEGVKATSGLGIFSHIKKALVSPVLFNKSELGAKLEYLVEVLYPELVLEHDRIVIWTEYIKVAELVGELLGLPVITGKVSPDKVSKMLTHFNSEGGLNLVATLNSMGEGQNLQRASCAVFIDRSLRSSVNENALGRIARIGQKSDSVLVVDLLYHGTFDIMLLDLLRRQASYREILQYALQERL